MYSVVCDDHTCIHIYRRVYPQLPPVIGVPRVCCGHASGISLPRLLWFAGCATHVTPCSAPGYSYFTICSEKSEHNCLTSYWYTAAILASFFLFVCLRRCFSLNLSNGNKKNNANQQKTRLEAIKPPTVFITALTGTLFSIGIEHLIHMIFFCYGSSNGYQGHINIGSSAPNWPGTVPKHSDTSTTLKK